MVTLIPVTRSLLFSFRPISQRAVVVKRPISGDGNERARSYSFAIAIKQNNCWPEERP